MNDDVFFSVLALDAYVEVISEITGSAGRDTRLEMLPVSAR